MPKRNPIHIFFTPHEVIAISIGIGRALEDIKATMSDPTYPWTPEARKVQRDMHAALTSAAEKLRRFGNVDCKLPPYEEGDEAEFFTKPS